ncbi:MAG: putative DNA binding domain-containing protein, partial [Selenomonadaceae bacterium]|nr:putative DNA binding domain-containing protein [Selenomonadaceae bacterium]
ESEMSEWKASWRDEYMKWLAAYAYNDGGRLYIGVNDDGYVIGLKDVRKLQESIPNTIRNKLLISPRVTLRYTNERGTNIRYEKVPPDISEKDINRYACGSFQPATESDQKKLQIWQRENPVYQDPDGRYYYLEIAVDHYPNLVTYNGVAYTRSGSTLQVLEGQELERAVLKSTGLSWDAFEASGKTMEDLSHDALEAFRKKAVEKKRLTPDQAVLADGKMVGKLGLLTDLKKLTRAAVMLFGDPESIVAGAYIKIGYFAETGTYGNNTINDVIYHDEVRGPLITQADNAIEYLYSKYLKALISYNGLQRVESYMIPQDAMREIILNAIAHKNYPSGNPIQIKVYDDHITIMNEGFWPFDYIRVEDAYTTDHDSYPRNPRIAEGLYMAGDIETWGSGFEKIKLACSRYGTPLPEINATKGNITIRINAAESYMRILKRGNTSAESAENPAESAENPADMKSRHREILNAMSQGKEYSAEEIGEMVSLKGSRTRELMKELVDLGYIEITGETKGRRYKRK